MGADVPRIANKASQWLCRANEFAPAGCWSGKAQRGPAIGKHSQAFKSIFIYEVFYLALR